MLHLSIHHNETEWEAVSFRLVSSCCGGDTLTLGSVCAAELTARVVGSPDLQDQIITATATDSATEWERPLGTFRVTQCSQNGNVTELTAYDAAYYAMGGDYAPDETTPPTSALAVLRDVCAQCGLMLADVTWLTDQPVSGDLTGHSCRDMAGYMAALLGCNAMIDREGRLSLRWFADSGQQITPDDYYSGGLKLEGETRLAGLSVTRTIRVRTVNEDGTVEETDQSETYTAGSGTGTVIAIDNPYATQEIVNTIWSRISTLGTYRWGSVELFGGLLTEPGDIVTVTDLQGNVSKVPVMGLTLNLDGGCRATITAGGKTETEVAANVQGPTGRLLNRIAADIAEFKQLSAENFKATSAYVQKITSDEAFIQRLVSNIAEIADFTIMEHWIQSSGTYTNEGGFDADVSMYLRNTDGIQPPQIEFGSRGDALFDYPTLALLTVGGGGTRATGVAAFDWVKLAAVDEKQGLEAFVKVWAKNRLVELSADTVQMDGDLSISGSIQENGTKLSDKYAAKTHTHDDRYYTESEINSKLNGKSNTNHTHSYLPLSGGTVSGDVSIAGNWVKPLSFVSSVTFASGQTPTGSTRFTRHNGMVTICYQGAAVAHSSGELLFTIPNGYRPEATCCVTFVTAAATFGVVTIDAGNGQCKVTTISSGAKGRIYFNCTYKL